MEAGLKTGWDVAVALTMTIGRPLRVDWKHDEAALFALYKAEVDRHLRLRWHVLWRARAGATLTETARVVGVGPRSARRWLAHYRAGGLDALRDHRPRGPGRAPRLDAAQQQQLRDHLAEGTTRTAAAARRWIGETFGVTYSRKGIDLALARFAARLKVPRPISDKAHPAAQAAWKGGALPTN